MEEDNIIIKKNQVKTANILEKIAQAERDSGKYTFEVLPLSLDCESGLSNAKDELISKIVNYDLHDYYTKHLAERTSFFKKIPFENFMIYQQDDSISSPLLKMNSELNHTAVELYTLLKYYMLDKHSSKDPIENVKVHLKVCLLGTEDIKDEAYVQVLKQLNQNNNK